MPKSNQPFASYPLALLVPDNSMRLSSIVRRLQVSILLKLSRKSLAHYLCSSHIVVVIELPGSMFPQVIEFKDVCAVESLKIAMLPIAVTDPVEVTVFE